MTDPYEPPPDHLDPNEPSGLTRLFLHLSRPMSTDPFAAIGCVFVALVLVFAIMVAMASFIWLSIGGFG